MMDLDHRTKGLLLSSELQQKEKGKHFFVWWKQREGLDEYKYFGPIITTKSCS